MAQEIAAAETVIFVDCALDQSPGKILLRELNPRLSEAGPGYASPRRAGIAQRGAGAISERDLAEHACSQSAPGASNWVKASAPLSATHFPTPKNSSS